MKILHIINNLGSGGAEKLIEEFAPIFRNYKDVDIEVLLLTDKKNVFDKKLIQNNIKIHVIKLRNIYNPLNIFFIAKHLYKFEYDIIHSHLFPTQYWVAFARNFIRKKNLKFVTTEHSTHNRRRDKRYFKVLDKYIYSKYDAIVSITEKTQKNLIEWISPQEELLKKFVIIENGVNLEKIYNAIPYSKEEINRDFKENDVLICMVGRFAEAKDQPTLIRAISKLPSNIHLILIGEGPLLKNNIQLANQLGVIDRVHFLGFRTDVDRILKSVDIVVLSSFWEGLSLSSIEGLASGKPFIASKVPGLEEIVSDYGLLFTQGDEEEFCSLVKKLIADKEFYYNKAKLCTLRAKEFDIKTMVERLKNLYDNLINNTL